eukprot:m.166697 g.166697  ORF g.166697 m.166697 type:complete len:417 (-) comp15290_c0_seq6:1497-2747(-)
MTVFRPLKVRPAVLLDYRSLELEFLGRKDISFQNFIQVWNDLQFGFVQVGCRSELQERRELFAELCECAWHRMGREQATVEVKFGMESEQCLIIVMNNMQEQTCAILALFCFYHTQTCTPPQKLRITPLQGQRLKELREICSKTTKLKFVSHLIKRMCAECVFDISKSLNPRRATTEEQAALLELFWNRNSEIDVVDGLFDDHEISDLHNILGHYFDTKAVVMEGDLARTNKKTKLDLSIVKEDHFSSLIQMRRAYLDSRSKQLAELALSKMDVPRRRGRLEAGPPKEVQEGPPSLVEEDLIPNVAMFACTDYESNISSIQDNTSNVTQADTSTIPTNEPETPQNICKECHHPAGIEATECTGCHKWVHLKCTTMNLLAKKTFLCRDCHEVWITARQLGVVESEPEIETDTSDSDH